VKLLDHQFPTRFTFKFRSVNVRGILDGNYLVTGGVEGLVLECKVSHEKWADKRSGKDSSFSASFGCYNLTRWIKICRPPETFFEHSNPPLSLLRPCFSPKALVYTNYSYARAFQRYSPNSNEDNPFFRRCVPR
jgi:hypothetical protein